MPATDLILNIIRILIKLISIFTIIYSIYQLWVALPLFKEYKNPVGKDRPYHKFAIVISAHNEELVIANLLDSIKEQNYPKLAYDVFLIADNCQDATASIARSKGAKVYERFDPVNKSKGHALNWFFPKFLAKYADDYDVCTVVDADNLLSKNFLKEMNRRFNLGERVVVGYRVGKNPDTSVFSNCNSLFWVMQNRAADHPRYVSGRSLVSVGGTGFSFNLDIIRKSGWHTESLTEDLEFSLEMNLRGEEITYCREAKFYDEQPENFMSTIKQRWRWSYGTKELINLEAPKLLKSIFYGREDNIDSLMFSLTYAFMIAATFVWTLLLIAEFISGGVLAFLKFILYSMLIGQISISLFIFVLSRLEKIYWEKQWLGILCYPAFLIIINISNILALFKKPEWKKIEHKDQKAIEDVDFT